MCRIAKPVSSVSYITHIMHAGKTPGPCLSLSCVCARAPELVCAKCDEMGDADAGDLAHRVSPNNSAHTYVRVAERL